MDITFGTDGWRAVLDKDFTGVNVERVTLAIGKYIADNFGFCKPILIGYDPRNKADEFSALCAELLKGKGFNVLYSSRVVPTPILAYNALIQNACAIMFTASHNPPEYLGIKFIPDYAGPATSDITDEIVKNIEELDEIIAQFAKQHYMKEAKNILSKTDRKSGFQRIDSLQQAIEFLMKGKKHVGDDEEYNKYIVSLRKEIMEHHKSASDLTRGI